MLRCLAPCCVMLVCAVSCGIVMVCVALYSVVLCRVVVCYVVLCRVVLGCVVVCCVVWFCRVILCCVVNPWSLVWPFAYFLCFVAFPFLACSIHCLRCDRPTHLGFFGSMCGA